MDGVLKTQSLAGDGPPTRAPLANRVLAVALLSGVALLAAFSIHLAKARIYQVDEYQNFYMAKVLAAGQSSEFFTSSALFLLGPLSWISQMDLRATEMLLLARLLFLGVFWLNLILLAKILAGRVCSTRGIIALAAAVSLAPLWDYGFEIRHDNLVLTGVLVIWWAVRTRPMGLGSYAVAGAVTVALLFTAVKTVVYALPLSLALLLFPPSAFLQPRWQLALAWLAGAVAATAVIRVAYGAGDAWDNYLYVFRRVTQYSTDTQGAAASGGSNRFWPWSTLGRLLVQSPLLLALTLAACFAILCDVVRRGKSALTWHGYLPEVLLCLGAFAALFVNPTPFPYNLLHLVPYALILSFRYGETLWDLLRERASIRPLATTLLVFVHAIPFFLATKRHLEWPNARQNLLMQLAEDVTDPAKDLVYDGIGMVATRRTIHYQWYLHSLNIRKVVTVPGRRVREMLAARPAAVFIPSYRTTWLPEEDHEFIRQRYVPVADDFWVLGCVLPAGGGEFEIFHPGRYQVVRLRPPPSTNYLQSTDGSLPIEESSSMNGNMDGVEISRAPVELSLGMHRLQTPADWNPAVIWVGPRLEKVPRPGPGNHRSLFWNWY